MWPGGEQSVRVCVRGGQLEIMKVRAEGGEKMPAAAYARSIGLTPGVRLDTDHAHNVDAASRRIKVVS